MSGLPTVHSSEGSASPPPLMSSRAQIFVEVVADDAYRSNYDPPLASPCSLSENYHHSGSRGGPSDGQIGASVVRALLYLRVPDHPVPHPVIRHVSETTKPRPVHAARA